MAPLWGAPRESQGSNGVLLLGLCSHSLLGWDRGQVSWLLEGRGPRAAHRQGKCVQVHAHTRTCSHTYTSVVL